MICKCRPIIDEEPSPDKHAHKAAESVISKPAAPAAASSTAGGKGPGPLSMPPPKTDLAAGACFLLAPAQLISITNPFVCAFLVEEIVLILCLFRFINRNKDKGKKVVKACDTDLLLFISLHSMRALGSSCHLNSCCQPLADMRE